MRLFSSIDGEAGVQSLMRHPEVILLISGDSGIQTQSDCLPSSWLFNTTQDFCLWVEKEVYSIIPFNLINKLYLWIETWKGSWYMTSLYHSSSCMPSVSSLSTIQFSSKSHLRGLQDTGSEDKFCGSSPWTFFNLWPIKLQWSLRDLDMPETMKSLYRFKDPSWLLSFRWEIKRG